MSVTELEIKIIHSDKHKDFPGVFVWFGYIFKELDNGFMKLIYSAVDEDLDLVVKNILKEVGKIPAPRTLTIIKKDDENNEN